MEKSNLELLRDLDIDIKRTGKCICPKCSHTRKKKKDPCLSVNVEDGWFRCHNCSWHGRVYNKAEYTPRLKEYVKPPFVNNTAVCQEIVEWFGKRGIRPKTLIDFNITQSNSYFPQIQGNAISMNFNYFRDGQLVNIKYRDANKNFILHKGCELIFYNLDAIKESKEVIIVEGEIDCMAVYQSGIKHVISVPNGATISNNPNLEYLDNCAEYFMDKEKIIIATDNDEAGLKLRNELARRFGYHRCFKVDFSDQKDANDYAVRYGEQNLKDVFLPQNLKEFPIEGVIAAKDVWDDVEYLFKHGLQRGDTTGFMPELDKLMSFVPGHTCVITGIPNHGKSPFVLMIMASLAIKHGWKWAIFSPEHKPLSIFIAKICELLLGKRLRQGIGFMQSEKDLVKSFIDEHFFFIEPENGDLSLESVIEKVKSLVMKKGIKGFIADPWNKFEHKMNPGENESSYISRSLDEVITFGQNFGVFNFIIAHPTKIRKKIGQDVFEIPNLYDISGSANWYNKPDWGITFYRDFKTGISTAYIQKAKWEHLGNVGSFEVKYNINNGRFVSPKREWDNQNWIAPAEVQGDIFKNYQEPVPDIELPVTDDEDEDCPF